ncbi:MAG: prepilin-type N-terminal cleavage/methylation domain-containing protein [Pirellulaceae bacterium]|nr:prepilin-type N-terminal cleavage/methylation domain-containing protein [Pirellulaceae bacterium]
MSHSCCVKARPANGRSLRGLTLLELVVVLGILAMLSTVAVRSLEPIADQARFEATQRVLNDLRVAIRGEAARRFATGPVVIQGFTADTGQLPSDADDLLTRPVSLIDHTIQNFDSDRDTVNDVTLSSGWQGPYLQLGAGQSQIVDGWGREPLLSVNGGGLDLLSTGSDGDSIGNESGYLANVVVPIIARDFRGDVVCRLFEIDALSGLRIDPSPTGTEQLGVLFYGVNAAGGTSGAVEEQLLIVPASGSFDVRRSSTLHGTVAMRAILWNDTDSDDALDGGETIVMKSYVHYWLVHPAVDNRVEMELR